MNLVAPRNQKSSEMAEHERKEGGKQEAKVERGGGSY